MIITPRHWLTGANTMASAFGSSTRAANRWSSAFNDNYRADCARSVTRAHRYRVVTNGHNNNSNYYYYYYYLPDKRNQCACAARCRCRVSVETRTVSVRRVPDYVPGIRPQFITVIDIVDPAVPAGDRSSATVLPGKRQKVQIKKPIGDLTRITVC